MKKALKWVFLITMALPFLQSLQADSIYPVEGAGSIYTEKRARRVGDVITVLIQETTKASQAAGSNNQKTSNLAVGAGMGLLGSSVLNSSSNQIGVGVGTTNQGQGTSNRSTTITAQMTAKIVSVLPSGNYLVEGSRYVAVNDEKQTIEVVGEVRPDDITSDNTVLSSRIANAKIKVTGTGPASETAKPGILTRLLSWLGLF